VCYQAVPENPRGLPEDVCGATVKGYLNAQTHDEAKLRIKNRMGDMGWGVEFLEEVELFNMETFDPEFHQAEVVQKAMDGKVAVEIEYWCKSDLAD
ncbi:MAG: hypothetical protein HQL32_16930, partial [Planctomycetes bacterium]|nr:hypothetical protein [Planctomycetota bacterium]